MLDLCDRPRCGAIRVLAAAAAVLLVLTMPAFAEDMQGRVVEIVDGDTVLLKVEQVGGIACHTGRRNCFYRLAGSDGELVTTDAVIKDPADIYGKQS